MVIQLMILNENLVGNLVKNFQICRHWKVKKLWSMILYFPFLRFNYVSGYILLHQNTIMIFNRRIAETKERNSHLDPARVSSDWLNWVVLAENNHSKSVDTIISGSWLKKAVLGFNCKLFSLIISIHESNKNSPHNYCSCTEKWPLNSDKNRKLCCTNLFQCYLHGHDALVEPHSV